ncbi:MAG TPA: STAS domain-containing protein [Candidatus Baltobacteraceae bacterium]|nr:STAS domain-containing protein [Candidatus Baltobacteraceae bacterium]
MPNGRVATGPLVVTLTGEFDIYNVDALGALLAPTYEHPDVVVDMSEVRYLDSTALTVFIRMRKRRMIANFQPARMVGLNPNIRRLFALTRLDVVWPIYETLDEALASFTVAS